MANVVMAAPDIAEPMLDPHPQIMSLPKKAAASALRVNWRVEADDGTSRGTALCTASVVVRPICDQLLQPQQYTPTLPFEVSAHDEQEPTARSTTELSSLPSAIFTKAGTDRAPPAVPSPSSPFSSSPQHIARLSSVMAQLKGPPSASFLIGCPIGTSTGRRTLPAAATPTCPCSLPPQQNTLPSFRNAHVCQPPALLRRRR